MNKSQHCKNCDNILKGKYCSKCGQKDVQILKLNQVIIDFFDEVLNFDSRLFRTLKYLILKPGFLTKEYWNGKRMKYISPFRLIILTSFIYFIILPYLLDTSNTLVEAPDISKDKLDLINIRLKETALFLAKYIFLAFTPFGAIILSFLYRIKKHLYIHHSIALLHWSSFNFFISSISSTIIYFFRSYESTLDIINISLILLYLFLILKNLYNESLFKTFFKFTIITISLILFTIALVGVSIATSII